MYRYSNGQISLADFNQPAGMNLKENNRWVKKAQTIPWLEIESVTLLCLRTARAMWPSHCGWLWEPASSRRSMDIPTKKLRCGTPENFV